MGIDFSRAFEPSQPRLEPRRRETTHERKQETPRPEREAPRHERETPPKEREAPRHERGAPRQERESERRGRNRRGRGRGKGAESREPKPRRHEEDEVERTDFSPPPPAPDVPEPETGWGGKFAEFPISKKILRAISEIGFDTPTEIQSRVIPIALEKRDVVGQARTGTGKTAAFAVPILDRMAKDPRTGSRAPRALILAPTRELALQIEEEFRKLGRHTGCRSVPVYGGASMEPQLRALRNGADVIIGTPGRVMDHVRRGTLRLDGIEVFVLDEADRMFDLGFRDDIYWVSRRLPESGRQTMLLSATMPDEVLRLAKQVTADPELVYTASGTVTLTVDTVEQSYIAVDHERKLELLLALVERENPEKGIVFTRTKRGADRVAARLRDKGIDAEEIHGDLRQKRRESILRAFREDKLRLLIATDVAARGLDISGVSHIFNHDIPENPEDYVHRIGRTARMGKKGRAITFVTRDDGPCLTDIEKLINKHIPREEVDGFRWEATAEERGEVHGEAHPLSEKLSPALMNLLKNAQRRGPSGPPRSSGGPRGGGGRGRDRGPPKGGGRRGGGGRRR